MAEHPIKHLSWRHWVVAILVIAGLLTIVGRLYQLQILENERYLNEAFNNRFTSSTVSAPRGLITDATGYPLAISKDTWDVYIDRYQWSDREKANESAYKISTFLGLDHDEIFQNGTISTFGDYLIYRDLDYKAGQFIIEQDLWGIRLIPSTVRQYPEGILGKQIIGEIGTDKHGLWGVESDFDHILRGQPGLLTFENDALGRPIAFTSTSLDISPVPGSEIQLTIDRFIQSIAEKELENAVERYKASGGSILVMNPRTGAILAMASAHVNEIDNSDRKESLPNYIKNRTITDLYEPGSVLKTLTTATAIDLDLVNIDTTYEDTGSVNIDGTIIRNWDFQSHGKVTVREYLQKSLNTGAVWLATEIGKDSFYSYFENFGLGSPTHLGLSGEASGLMRTPSKKDWYRVDLAANSYGQGLSATPLQVLTAINSFANDGKLMRPYIVSKIITENEIREYQPVLVRQVVKEKTAKTMGRLMRDVVHGTTYHGARLKEHTVAGKTGTTIVSSDSGYDFNTTIATFAGFVPYELPIVSILVKIDTPEGDLRLGGQVAAPVFAKVAKEIMNYKQIPSSYDLVATNEN